MAQAGKQKKRKQLLKSGFDLPFFLLVMVLLLLGLVMMFSASYADAYYNHGQDALYYIKRQGAFALLGVAALLFMSRYDYHRLHKFAWPVLVITYGLLMLVLVMPAGTAGVHRWIKFGPINIQPSEVAKFAIILTFAHLVSIYASKRNDRMKTFKYGVVPFLLILGSVAALIRMEPHLSATIIVLMIGLTLMFIGGTKLRWFFAGGGIAGAAIFFATVMTHASKYGQGRIKTWLDPFSDPTNNGWQIIQSLYAIGSGGLMGLGLGKSRQKYLYISEPQNDFIFPVICEELGFIGAVIIIILFALLIWRGYVIAMRAPDKFGSLLAVGLITQVGLQAILNIAVVTNTIPNTGISLPFFSYGGSSLVMLMFEMGIVLSVSRYSSVEQT
jgi:cell division protein FtsW